MRLVCELSAKRYPSKRLNSPALQQYATEARMFNGFGQQLRLFPRVHQGIQLASQGCFLRSRHRSLENYHYGHETTKENPPQPLHINSHNVKHTCQPNLPRTALFLFYIILCGHINNIQLSIHKSTSEVLQLPKYILLQFLKHSQAP